MNKKIIVLGGDGFCGWPTALHLSNAGYDVLIVDNLSRRDIDNELEVESLTPIKPMGVRVSAWEELTGKRIEFQRIDIAKEYCEFLDIVREYQPDVMVHFAEQRSAPYSMKTSSHKQYTVSNNLNATNNVLCAIIDSGLDIHLVHLGTMGVYGYGSAGMKIPEGYLDISIKNDAGEMIDKEILYPASPGSVYHLTKTQDQLMFQYYNQNDNIAITDLHQGVVWGTQTTETRLDYRLVNRFDYDGDYGTVLNRFLMQSVVGYPLTVHGSGGQTRAFIHIQDTVKCIEVAIQNKPNNGDRVAIYNQMTETHKVRDLANMIVDQYPGSSIEFIKNPRNEDAENELHVKNDKFVNHGLKLITLNDGLFDEIATVVEKYKQRCDLSKIPCTSFWEKGKS